MRLIPFLLALAIVGCWNEKERVDELLSYKVEDFKEKNGREPSVEEIAVLQTEAEALEREEAKERKAQALREGAEGVGAFASGNLLGGALMIGGAVLTFFGLRGVKTGKPQKP